MSRARLLLLPVLLALALILAGAAGASISKEPMQTFVLAKGQVLKITVASNPTTGFRWVLAEQPNPKVIKLLSQNYKASEPQRMGSGGTETWAFQAVGPGRVKINLIYLRPWEKSKPPARSRLVEVEVR
ncbi:MAG: protease inhibitor I42 family protein [Thermodesulfobacteriota bacterium]